MFDMGSLGWAELWNTRYRDRFTELIISDSYWSVFYCRLWRQIWDDCH